MGKNFVKTIIECLWYVDGHHEKLKKQYAPIPDYHARFTGYNLPELSKYRKRQGTNLSSSVLKSLSSKSASVLLEPCIVPVPFPPYWDTCPKPGELLQLSFLTKQGYEDPLCTTSASETAVKCAIKYVHPCTGVVLGRFDTSMDTVDKKEFFEHMFLIDLSTDKPRSRSRYEYIHTS